MATLDPQLCRLCVWFQAETYHLNSRHPKEKGQELIGQGLDTLWMAVHSVQGIMFKDLKQILRKEQVKLFDGLSLGRDPNRQTQSAEIVKNDC